LNACAPVLVFGRRLEGARHVVVARGANHPGEVSVVLDVETADARFGHRNVRERAATELDLESPCRVEPDRDERSQPKCAECSERGPLVFHQKSPFSPGFGDFTFAMDAPGNATFSVTCHPNGRPRKPFDRRCRTDPDLVRHECTHA
jgi:hypothetical protein